MNFVKRAMLYVSRQKGKTFRLFLLIFMVAVFLISCFRILNATEALAEDIRTSIGAAFYIRANTEASMNENGETELRKNEVHITQKEIDEIMKLGEIKYYNPVNYGFAKSDRLAFIPGDKHTEENNMGKVTALRFSALASDFAEKAAILTEGEHITETDSGKILLSEELAATNHLSVGDLLTLTHARLGEEDGSYVDEIPVKTAYVSVEVCGIYQRNTPDTSIQPTAGIAENEIYASLDVLNSLKESDEGIYTGEVGFYLTNPAKLKDITRNVQLLPSIDWQVHFIRSNDFQYSKIAEQLAALGNLVKILLMIVSVISALILILLLAMRMRGRMREAGILLAAGISKKGILTGFLLEVLSVSVLALVLSNFVSPCVTKWIGNILFHELPANLLNEKTLTESTGVVSMKNHLKLSGIETMFIYLCQLIVIVVSTILSSIMMMRLKPKDILSKM
ncbi:MAG: FtsX-like permease family protein [Ruminococcus flavefaciens]|nr:FtsX-like permease family protein [Ruminococcus flavefaciens]